MEIAARALPEEPPPRNAKLSPDQEAAKTKATETKKATKKKKKKPEPPLSDYLVKRGTSTIGVSEMGARLPFFLLALMAGLATYFLGQRVRSARSGLLAAMVLGACPLFLFQAQQITTEMGAMAGGALMLLGFLGLCSPPKQDQPFGLSGLSLRVLDILLLVAGSGLAHYHAGFFLGVLAPMGGITLALLISLAASTEESTTRRQRIYLLIATIITTLLFLAALSYLMVEAFDLVEAGDNEFDIASKTFHAEKGYQPLLAGAWKSEGSVRVNFNSLFEQIGFGLFPWICLAPIALGRMGLGGSRGTSALGARMLFGWAAVAWVLASVLLRKVGPVQYAAVPAVAAGIGVWLDELLTKREQDNKSALVPPLVALFALFAVIVLSKDIKSFPATFLSLHLDKAIAKFPEGVSLHKAVMGLGMVFGLMLATGLGFNPTKSAPCDRNQLPSLLRKNSLLADVSLTLIAGYRAIHAFLARHGLHAAIAVSLLMSMFFVDLWIPRLSKKLSSKAAFSMYHQLHEEGNSLGSLGKPTSGAKYYAKRPFETLRGRPDLMKFLQRPERVFALVKAGELCPIHKESNKRGIDYYVVDDSNAERVILSNRMWNDKVPPPPGLHGLMRGFLDENPLSRYIVREEPQGIQHRVSANFDDKLELIGLDMPRSTSRSKSFEMTLYYKVLKPIRRNWQVFVHFDGGGVRFQGDHYPVKKRCGTNYWQAGDFIVDRFTVDAPGRTYPNTSYRIWTGLFVGSSGNWENMKATTGNPDDNNRVPVGTISLQ